MGHFGVKFAKPEVDVDGLRGWKESVVKKLTGGLSGLAKGRKVTVVEGVGTFTGPNAIRVEGKDGAKTVSFDQCIIAAGSEPVKLPFIPDDPRVIDSTGALELQGVPKRLLVIGGGIIGLEMACVYDALGTKVTIVELMDQIIPGADADIVKPLHKRIERRYEAIHLKAKVTGVKALDDRARGGDGGAERRLHRRVRPGAGRGRPPAERQGRSAPRPPGVTVDERGFIPVDNQQRTNVPHIFAIGDVVGQPMLAHKAVHEGKVAAEVAAGSNRVFDARVIPSVAYTDPEVAWVGMTETEAKAKGVKVGKGVFPWAASGRSLSPRARRGHHQGAVRRGRRPGDRRRHRRAERRRPDRRGGARDRDGRGRHRHRPDHPPAPDAVGDGQLRRRDVRGHDHRPDPAEEAPLRRAHPPSRSATEGDHPANVAS